MALTAYANADHVVCQDTRRSTSGSAHFLGDKLVSWSSKKQKSTAISTTEAEYIAMSGCSLLVKAHRHTSLFHKRRVENGVVELYFVTTDCQLANIFTKALPTERFEFLLPWLGMKSKMAEENVHAPTRTDEQLVLVKACLPIGKSNLLMDLQKMQKNLIFRLSNTLTMDTKSGIYIFRLDELRFTLDADLLRSALGITPKDSAHHFVAPPAGDLSISSVENYSIHDQPMLNRQDFCQSQDDYSLGNLKFVPKGELDEKYLDMAARKPRQATTIEDEEGGKRKKALPAGKSKKPAPAK
ncbi:hypothetical protein Tco_0629362 [Tanacetum coccineum]|uniref:Uncharacterized protein n=1 Tax=Tanacetum coccineum TaxID=301880 RepID=A0ABQ4WSX3_9ASTR